MKNIRWRGAEAAVLPVSLEGLRGIEKELLTEWARRSSKKPKWLTLLDAAGTDRLELASVLAEKLVERGIARLQEQLRDAVRRPTQLAWLDLPALQLALGLRRKSDDDEARAEFRSALRALESDAPGVVAAARALADAPRLSLPLLQARSELLFGLADWCAQQRRGMRQDFAHHARRDTKDITPSEWKWLETLFDLDALGVERFAPLLWVATDRSLIGPSGRIDGAVVPFMALPVDAVLQLQSIAPPVERYWLIENRACFERQARKRAAGQCLLWLPGRPSEAWLKAVRHLLATAPAPAWISTDADPAGIEIALTAAALWDEAAPRLVWSAHAMEPERLTQHQTMALNTYDVQTLARLRSRSDLPASLRALAEAIGTGRCKAEQEGWL